MDIERTVSLIINQISFHPEIHFHIIMDIFPSCRMNPPIPLNEASFILFKLAMIGDSDFLQSHLACVLHDFIDSIHTIGKIETMDMIIFVDRIEHFHVLL